MTGLPCYRRGGPPGPWRVAVVRSRMRSDVRRTGIPMAAGRICATTVAAVVLASAGCGGGSGGTDAASSKTSTPITSTSSSSSSTPGTGTGPVRGLIAIGHSGLTGENSDPRQPGLPATQNSWATGSSRRVDSVYLRMAAALPETRGHVANAATGGAPVEALESQAQAALATVPNPALVIVQTLDDDITCDGDISANVRGFGATLKTAIRSITTAAPKAKVLIVGQLGRPSATFVATLVDKHPTVKAELTGSGPCDFYDEGGHLNKAGFRTLTKIINRYEAEEARVCSAFKNCATDGGVRAAYTDTLANFTNDWNHINVRGQAQEAEIIWPVVAKLLRLNR